MTAATQVSPSLPPSLPSHPLIQTLRYVAKPLPLLDDCAQRFGDIFTLQLLGTGNWVILSSPKDLKAMFTAEPKVAHAGEANSSIFGVLSGDSTVLTMDEDSHLRSDGFCCHHFTASGCRCTSMRCAKSRCGQSIPG